jgi:uncharacterized YigZ family protein
MSNDTYKTIQAESKGIFKDRGSKFLAFAFPVKSEDEIKNHLQFLRKEFHDARHQCYAYRLGVEDQLYRTYDDGEPSGTAGKPIYGQILSQELTNILIVVVRYFGGTLLGTTGLIHAYRTAAKECLANSLIIYQLLEYKMKLLFRYEEMNSVMRVLKEEAVIVSEQKFDSECSLSISVGKSRVAALYERLNKLNHVTLIAD